VSSLSEQLALAQVKERLTSTYADVPPEQVSSVIQSVHARFEASKIRDFVPLLVERRARRELLTWTTSAVA
jgi:hypothetical protein